MSLGIDQGPSDAGSVLLVGVFPPKGRHYAAVGEQIAARLRARGWKVHLTSRAAGRMARPLSMAKAVVLSRGKFQVAVVDLFSGPAFFWGLLTCTLLMRLRKPYVLALRGGNLPVFSERYGRLVEFV